MTAAIDEARSVRDEDQLDIRKIDAFLKQHVDGLRGEPTISQFPGGASNLTYLSARHAARGTHHGRAEATLFASADHPGDQ